jgi:hypothetical protein
LVDPGLEVGETYCMNQVYPYILRMSLELASLAILPAWKSDTGCRLWDE